MCILVQYLRENLELYQTVFIADMSKCEKIVRHLLCLLLLFVFYLSVLSVSL